MSSSSQSQSIQDDEVILIPSNVVDPLDSIKIYGSEQSNDQKKAYHIMNTLKKIVVRIVDLFDNDQLCHFYSELRLIGYTRILHRYFDPSKEKLNLSRDFFITMKNVIQEFMVNDINVIKRVIPEESFKGVDRERWANNCHFLLAFLTLSFP